MVRRAPFPAIELAGLRITMLREAWRVRRERLWLGLVAVPLAMVATGLSGVWWAWPVLAAGAWSCTRSWPWSWLLAIEEGAIGMAWAFAGAAYLASYSDERAIVAVVWAAFPLALAAASLRNRRRAARPEAYFPLR